MATSLTYFDFHGSRGLECRLALTLAGVDFEDIRISREQWLALKPNTPFGGLPILQEDGRQLAQCNTILSYIGRKHGLLPQDPWVAAEHEALMASLEALRAGVGDVRRMSDDEKRSARQAFAEGALSRWARTASDRIVGPFVEGAGIQVVDLKIFVMVRSFRAGAYDHIAADFFDRWPKVHGVYEAVAQHPKIAAYFVGK